METLHTLDSTEKTMEEQEVSRLQIEERILRYFQNKEIEKERKEENKMLFEEIEYFFNQSGEGELLFQLPNGEFAILTQKAVIRDILDKEGLAQSILVAQDELKTPFDFSMYTAQGKLTPEMISKYTETETQIKVKLAKRKTKPKKSKIETD